MLEALKAIANQSDLFPHLRTTPRYVCEDCPEANPKAATHEYQFTADLELATDTTYLCDHCTEANDTLGMLDGYEDRGNPNT